MNVLSLFDLSSKTALITGCKRGIGRAMAEALAEAGADIIGVSATLEPHGSEVERAVQLTGRRFTGYACDFADRNAVYAFIGQVLAEHRAIDILVNNAGTVYRRPAVEYPDDEWDRQLDTNLSAHFILSRELGRAMVAAATARSFLPPHCLASRVGLPCRPMPPPKAG